MAVSIETIAKLERERRLHAGAAEEMYEALQYIADKQLLADPTEMHARAASLLAHALNTANGHWRK